MATKNCLAENVLRRKNITLPYDEANEKVAQLMETIEKNETKTTFSSRPATTKIILDNN